MGQTSADRLISTLNLEIGKSVFPIFITSRRNYLKAMRVRMGIFNVIVTLPLDFYKLLFY